MEEWTKGRGEDAETEGREGGGDEKGLDETGDAPAWNA
jgi:hypothetical protein